ncbi:MAG: DMT family transporter [Anaerolineae bacterium]|nr:DMT family transporter [Anaerolineae bacterium]
MLPELLTILIGVLGGVAVGVQSPIANNVGQKVGGAAGSLIVHISGALLSAVVLIIKGGENIRAIRSLQWWMFGVGFFGVILYLTIVYTIPRIGVAPALTLIIVGQLSAGMLIDHFGLFGVEVRLVDGPRLLAAALLLSGGYLMTR